MICFLLVSYEAISINNLLTGKYGSLEAANLTGVVYLVEALRKFVSSGP